jgi:heterotetrameric sarcosine oxidase gamma subunit
MVERLSALASVYRPGDFGTPGPVPAIVIAERRPLAMVQVAAFGGEGDVMTGMAGAVGVTPDPRPNRAATGGDTSVLWLGAGRWLVVEPVRPDRDLEQVLRRALPETGAAVTDLSESRTVLRIAGPRARDVLAKGCPVDLHARAFPVGACAQSLLGHVGALFHAVDATPSFDVYVARSFALTVWEWMTEAAAEYGYRVAAWNT